MRFVVIDFNKRKNIRIPVLMYHDLVEQLPKKDPFDYEYMTTGENFEANLMALLKNGYQTISFRQLYNAVHHNKSLPEKPVVITFDDGYEGQYTIAYPILKRHRARGIIFVNSDVVGKELEGKKYFDWKAARVMQQSGVIEIGSHGKRHIDYTQLPINEFTKEVMQSFEEMEKHLGKIKLKLFAYPHGLYTKSMVESLKKNKVAIQATGLGMNEWDTINLSQINRINVPDSVRGEKILELV